MTNRLTNPFKISELIETVNNLVDTTVDDSNLVHKTGNETIDGIKTFNNAIHFNNSVYVDAAAGDEGGEIEFAKAPNSSLTGNVKLDIYQNSMRIFGSGSDGNIRVIINANIEENKVYMPTPATSSNDDTVATTAYVNNKLSSFLPNYSSASNKSLGTQYTAANNCMVICNGTVSTNGDRQTAVSYFYIDGSKYLKAEHWNVYGNGSAPFSFTVFLKKGQTYKMVAEAYNCNIYKYVEIPLA